MFQMGSMKKSEFELQADMYSAIKARGLNVRGEVRGSVNGVKTGRGTGNKVRLDLVVFKDSQCREPMLAIEVKPTRSARWADDYKERSGQYEMYQHLGFPVLMVCGEDEAKSFLCDPTAYLNLPAGVNWLSAP